MSSQFALLCALTSFLWLAHSLESHQIIEQPRLSSLLVLLIAGASSYAASFGARWLPGANGRFDDELAPLKTARAKLPKKPRRYFLPSLVICILLRLEIFHRVAFDMQCSNPGIEAFLPLAILLYERLPGCKTRAGTGDDDEEISDDIGMTVFDALADWYTRSKSSLWIGTILLTGGAYLASSQDLRSTFVCSSHDRSALIFSLQWAGLLLDTAIATMVWRILGWSRTTKSRLRTLGGLLSASALCTGVSYLTSRLILPSRSTSYSLRGLDALYVFDLVVDGLAFAAFLISTSLLAVEGSPLPLVGIIAFLFGLRLTVHRTFWLTGTWENISPSATYFALILLCVGFSFFLYGNDIRLVVSLHRAFVVCLLIFLAITATIYTPIKAGKGLDEHPLRRIIYNARVEADRWLVHATVSSSLSVAVQEYQERNHGRNPPPKFDIWYQFAAGHRSAILDHFPQIENDIRPFWGVPPSKIREHVRRAAAEPDMAILQIQDGKPQHNLPLASPYNVVMDDFVDLVKGFAEHLPNMELAVNLDERPRVLAPWDQVQRSAGARKRISKLLPRDLASSLGMMPVAQAAVTDKRLAQENSTSVKALREMTALACPPGTKTRSGNHWNIRDVCTACTKPQSQGQYLTDWPIAQDICHQSDLLSLHSFYMTPPALRPLQELLPVFSRAKTESYSDILIPLRRITEASEPTTDGFDMKWKTLFWRGNVDRPRSGHELLRGGHQERLDHTINGAAHSDQTRLLLPKPGNTDNFFAFQQVPTDDLNALLPMDVAFVSYHGCQAGGGGDGACEALSKEFRRQPDAEPLTHQYVMVMDTDDGPPRDFLRTLRSGSVPFYASIFKEWYSERLIPWAHFVPIDLRFHALHSTLAYFAGIQNKEGRKLNGREVSMAARQEDGKWIAEEGQRWAAKALRSEDREVYMFRLLLEWGRIIDEKRDEIGFVLQ